MPHKHFQGILMSWSQHAGPDSMLMPQCGSSWGQSPSLAFSFTTYNPLGSGQTPNQGFVD